MVTPNEGRIIVELLRTGDKQGQIFLPTRENTKAGENLFLGKVIHPGNNYWGEGGYGRDHSQRETRFKKGQIVMFMEYSMAGFYKDIKSLADGTVAMTETLKPENQYHVIAEADVVAYDAD